MATVRTPSRLSTSNFPIAPAMPCDRPLELRANSRVGRQILSAAASGVVGEPIDPKGTLIPDCRNWHLKAAMAAPYNLIRHDQPLTSCGLDIVREGC
jgi:hypothetical protein